MEMEEGGEGDEGKRLAEVVKETHRLLRTRYKEAGGGGAGAGVWTEHVGQEEQLQRYAKAMHILATRHWPSETEVRMSRVGWVRAAVRDYFWGGGMTAATEKEMRKLQHLGLPPDQPHIPSSPPLEGKIRVLDVGSCYNPFLVFPEFEVTALDLYPAHQSVLKADFLSLEIVEEEDRDGVSRCSPPSPLQQARGLADQQVTTEREGDKDNTTAESQEQKTQQAGRSQRMAAGEVKELMKEGEREVNDEAGGMISQEMRAEVSQENDIEKNEETGEEEMCQHGGGGGGGEEGGRSVERSKEEHQEITSKQEKEHQQREEEEEATSTHQQSTSGKRKIGQKHEHKTVGGEAETGHSHSTITSLPAAAFEVVVLSLVLEYLPAPTQRWECCEKAWRLLVPGGLLAIVTPDSRHQGANAHLYHLWRVTLAGLGFGRIKYDKQSHFHGLVFRKGLCRVAWQGDATRFLKAAMSAAPSVRAKLRGIDYSKVDREMYIPQDFDDEGTQRHSGSGKRGRKGCEGQGRRKRGKRDCEGEGGERDESKADEVEKGKVMNGKRGRDEEVVVRKEEKDESCVNRKSEEGEVAGKMETMEKEGKEEMGEGERR